MTSVAAPHDLAKHFHWHGEVLTGGQLRHTITMRRSKPDPERVKSRRNPRAPQRMAAIWGHSQNAVRDDHTLTARRNRAQAIIDGDRPGK